MWVSILSGGSHEADSQSFSLRAREVLELPQWLLKILGARDSADTFAAKQSECREVAVEALVVCTNAKTNKFNTTLPGCPYKHKLLGYWSVAKMRMRGQQLYPKLALVPKLFRLVC